MGFEAFRSTGAMQLLQNQIERTPEMRRIRAEEVQQTQMVLASGADERWLPASAALVALLIGLATMTSWLIVPAAAVLLFEIVRWQVRNHARRTAARHADQVR